jgi:hypothetical protein
MQSRFGITRGNKKEKTTPFVTSKINHFTRISFLIIIIIRSENYPNKMRQKFETRLRKKKKNKSNHYKIIFK